MIPTVERDRQPFKRTSRNAPVAMGAEYKFSKKWWNLEGRLAGLPSHPSLLNFRCRVRNRHIQQNSSSIGPVAQMVRASCRKRDCRWFESNLLKMCLAFQSAVSPIKYCCNIIYRQLTILWKRGVMAALKTSRYRPRTGQQSFFKRFCKN